MKQAMNIERYAQVTVVSARITMILFETCFWHPAPRDGSTIEIPATIARVDQNHVT
jgi:hypothetical protein